MLSGANSNVHSAYRQAVITASIVDGRSFWAGDEKTAVRGVGAGCSVGGVALTEKEAFTFSLRERDEHEIVAV